VLRVKYKLLRERLRTYRTWMARICRVMSRWALNHILRLQKISLLCFCCVQSLTMASYGYIGLLLLLLGVMNARDQVSRRMRPQCKVVSLTEHGNWKCLKFLKSLTHLRPDARNIPLKQIEIHKYALSRELKAHHNKPTHFPCFPKTLICDAL
jgi:hypothetical protein